MRIIVIFSTLVALAACSSEPQVKSFRWGRLTGVGSKQSLPNKEIEQLIKNSKLNRQIGDVKLIRGQQSVAGAEVINSWYQVLTSATGELLYVASEMATEDLTPFTGRIQKLTKNADAIIQKLKSKHSGLKSARWVGEPKIVLKRETFSYVPLIQVDYANSNETDVFRLLINEQGRIRQSKSVTFAVDGSATVFPNSPAQSNLSEEILKGLIGDGTLTSSLIKVDSALNQTAYNPENVFRYTPDEKNFDEVQAYFFADKIGQWFLNELNLNLPKRLDVKVHIGGLVPTNAAFYYQGQVRLGEGDGIAYRGIARDPGIVCHEVSHAYVELLSGLPFEGEGGSYSEAFADYFAASSLNNPHMGDYAYLKAPYRRTLENKNRAWVDFQKKVYNDSLVISGTFWDLRTQLGAEKADKLAKAFLMRIGQGGKFKDFVPVINEAILAELSSAEEQAKAKAVVETRGWLQRVGE